MIGRTLRKQVVLNLYVNEHFLPGFLSKLFLQKENSKIIFFQKDHAWRTFSEKPLIIHKLDVQYKKIF